MYVKLSLGGYSVPIKSKLINVRITHVCCAHFAKYNSAKVQKKMKFLTSSHFSL